jgi:hypothetical protein
MMPADDRKRALEYYRAVLAGEMSVTPETGRLLAQLIAELIRRGKRMADVYAAAIEYGRGTGAIDGNEHMRWLKLRTAACKATVEEDADELADKEQAA